MRNVIWPDAVAVEAHRALRRAKPLTFGLTNYNAASLSANVLLAAGASPAIGGNARTVAHLAGIARGFWINLAAIITDEEAIPIAGAKTAAQAGKPWVLDPVGVGGGARMKDDLAQTLLAFRPGVIRGNASEIIAPAGGQGGTSGVDSTALSEEAIPFAASLARRVGCIVAVSGPTDYVTDGTETVAVPGGHVYLTLVTGAGCSLGALIAAFAGTSADVFSGVLAAHALYARAAETAAAQAGGPGTFSALFLDQLYQLGKAL